MLVTSGWCDKTGSSFLTKPQCTSPQLKTEMCVAIALTFGMTFTYGFDMTPIRDIALKEPVVDVVDAKALVTDCVPILTLDILTCTKKDLDFTANFKLQSQRNDYVHGLVSFFECAFTQIHKPIGFSTSPLARYTHWKQTILYLQDPLTVCAGETITGQIACKPNKRNRRDLDITLHLGFRGRYSSADTTIQYRLR